VTGLRLELLHALRALRRAPGFATAAILTLALGIGANTAIFSVVNGVLLRPLPFPDDDRLVWVWGRSPLREYSNLSFPDFVDFREQVGAFERLSAVTAFTPLVNLTAGDRPEQVQGTLVAADFFETLGVRPALGRGLGPGDERVALPAAAVLSHDLWRRRFGADPAVVGRSVGLDGRSVTVVGVMPPGFRFPSGAEIWLPAPALAAGMQVRRAHFMGGIGRLRPGVSLQETQAEAAAVAARLAALHPDSNTGWSVRLAPLRESIVGDTRPALLLLMAAVGFVLLIACANVANLLLARGAARARELSIRAALGAGRGRLLGQSLLESGLLALGGGALGVLLAAWGVDALRSLAPADLPRIEEVTLDGAILGYALLASLLAAALSGLPFALQAARADLHGALREGGHAPAVAVRRRLRSALVVSEVALSVVLLAGAGLLIRSFSRLTRVDPGFETGGTATARIQLVESRYGEPGRRAALVDELLRRLAALPGVEAAGAATELPLSGQNNDTYFVIEGQAPAGPGGTLDANMRRVSPGYFRALGVPLLRGRGLSERDRAGAPGAVVVNEPFAHSYFPDGEPLGRRLVIDLGQPFPAEIVGVVGGMRHHAMESAAPPEMYLAYAQAPASWLNLVVRGRGAGAGDHSGAEPAIAAEVRATLAAIDPEQPVGPFRPMETLVASSLAPSRFRTLLLGTFAAMALVLAAIGLHGVLAFLVSRRTREIGIRMALGARRADIVALVLEEGARLVLPGLALGLVGAVVLGRALSSLLFGVGPLDPATFCLIPAVLALVAGVASYLPARRAARVDPAVALRQP
jgi:putative ABC transport system permease protein